MNFLFFFNRPWFSKDRFTTLEAFMVAYLGLLLALIGYQGDRVGSIEDLLTGQVIQQSMQTTATLAVGQSNADFGWAQGYRLWTEINALGLIVEDEALAAQYHAVRDRIRSLSPVLQEPYFDEAMYGTEDPLIAAYESDTYFVKYTLEQQRLADTIEQLDAWSEIGGKYGLLSNILTAGLLLTGLMVTLVEKDSVKRFAFAIVVLMAVYATYHLARIVQDNVPRRPAAAMQKLAEGAGLLHQFDYTAAIAAFTEALEIDPTYTEAYVKRGFAMRDSFYGLDVEGQVIQPTAEELAAATADFEAAVEGGRTEAEVIGQLAELYYLQGQFAEAQRVSQIGIDETDLFIHTFDLGRSTLASGDFEGARATYAQGMAEAIALYEAATREQPLSSQFWRDLDLAAVELDALVLCAEEQACKGAAPYASLQEPAETAAAARDLGVQVKSLSMSLELKKAAPAPDAAPITASAIRLTVDEDYLEDDSTFINGVREIHMAFDYLNAPAAATIVVKVFIDDAEYVPLRQISTLDNTPDGTYTVTLRPGTEFGVYTVQAYIDGRWVQQKNFEILGW